MLEEAPATIISNTTPLFYLHQIERLDILHRLYGSVCATGQVLDELFEGGILPADIGGITWLKRCDVQIPDTLLMIPDLGLGEASAIALALEYTDPVLLLLDDQLARRIAKLNSLPLTGTAGVLIRAKERGLISEVRPLMEKILELGFYLRSDHLSLIYRLAGE